MKKTVKLILTASLILAVFVAVIFIARSLSNNPQLLEFVAGLGYFGVTFIAIVSGLNAFIPVPAATFTPIFLEAGMVLPLIILFLVLGTLIADFLSFILGRVSREVVISKYPKTFDFVTKLQKNHRGLIIPVVIIYASVVPFPNEALLIPLALSGIKFKTLIIPLIIGNTIYQTVIIYGVNGLLSLFT